MKKLIIKNYFIDEQGNVYVNDKKLKPQVDKNGYLWVNLTSNLPFTLSSMIYFTEFASSPDAFIDSAPNAAL